MQNTQNLIVKLSLHRAATVSSFKFVICTLIPVTAHEMKDDKTDLSEDKNQKQLSHNQVPIQYSYCSHETENMSRGLTSISSLAKYYAAMLLPKQNSFYHILQFYVASICLSVYRCALGHVLQALRHKTTEEDSRKKLLLWWSVSFQESVRR